MELKGNKGEWSEIYIFFKLLRQYVVSPDLCKNMDLA